MRISDWSSDVCSSDLFCDERLPPLANVEPRLQCCLFRLLPTVLLKRLLELPPILYLLGELNERSGQFVLKCALVGSCGGQRIGCPSPKHRCPSDTRSAVIHSAFYRTDLLFKIAKLRLLRPNPN